MALSIGTNNSALQAAAAASSVNRNMETSMERLSTGKRINSASDDAAGVAISSRLSSEVRGTNQSVRNALDAQALIDTAEGAHKEVENILQRMRELAIQAANGTNNADDITNLEAEFTAMSKEIERIGESTSFAGKALTDEDGKTFSSPLLFSAKGGGFTAQTVVNLFKRIYRMAGIDGASSHSGRRQFVTNLADKGINARVVQALARHKHLSTTQRYIDINDNKLRAAVELI